MKQKIKLGIILGIEFVAIAVILILVFFSGKKTYTVTFDLNGGVLLSGELEQTVVQGKSATAPEVAKEGCYLHSWSASFRSVTKNLVIKAIWEWDTSAGFRYSDCENADYCEIEGAYEHLYGDVYVGAYHDEKIILGLKGAVKVPTEDGEEEQRVGAFYDHDGITNIYMLDGMLYIGDYAFAECDNLKSVELPGTLKELGQGAFENCVSLERVVFPDELEVIPANAFAGCTSLKEIVIPASVKKIETGAFSGCTSLEKITFKTKEISEEDEQTGEITTVKHGLVALGDSVFSGCTLLTEVVLPETVETVSTGTFAGYENTVKVSFNENEVPEGFEPEWDSSVTVEWGYVAPPEPEEDEDEDEDGRKRR